METSEFFKLKRYKSSLVDRGAGVVFPRMVELDEGEYVNIHHVRSIILEATRDYERGLIRKEEFTNILKAL